jgi:hypothetical protein
MRAGEILACAITTASAIRASVALSASASASALAFVCSATIA